MASCDPILDVIQTAVTKWVSGHILQCNASQSAGYQKCAQQKDEGQNQCSQQKDEGQNQCSQQEDDGYNSCSQTADEGYNQCCDWAPCSWACNAVVWVSNVVCVAWTWVSNVVCVAWTWVSDWVCVAWTWVSDWVCVLWVTVKYITCRVTTWLVGVVVNGMLFVLGMLCPILEPIIQSLAQHLCSSETGATLHVSQTPRLDATAFSVAAVPSRFAYRDGGQRYLFRIENAMVRFSQDGGVTWNVVSQQAISFDSMRKGVTSTAPPFDMVAANGGRVIAKEAGTDRCFLAILDPMFWQFMDPSDPEAGIDGPPSAARAAEMVVPSTYFKLDPEENTATAQTADLTAPLAGNFNMHPAAERFDFFSTLLAAKTGVVGQLFHGMVVRVQPRLWHLIDPRPATGSGRVPTGIPSYAPARYCGGNTPSGGSPQCAVAFDAVLDVGVGHAHWHEQYNWTFGGEMQALKSLGAGNVPVLAYYQLFNGPIVDGDGFVDGTCNYYMMVKLSRPGTTGRCDTFASSSPVPPTPTPQQFALLFLDEQSLFSQRWRIAHPSDSESLMFALLPDLNRSPNPYNFDIRTFWDPFRAACVTAASRMAVSRQVVLVSGRDASTGIEELYSINFSWATADRTWRWRQLPTGIEADDLSAGDMASGTETVTGDAAKPERALPQTVRLREDTTLHVKGTHAVGSARGENAIRVGRWFQKYLPADAQPVPDASTLVVPAAGQQPNKPATGYTHPWQFLPEETFQRVDQFSHFGVYEESDSRSQFYVVQLDESALPAGVDESTRWEDRSMQLGVVRAKFDWECLTAATPGSQGATLATLATAFTGNLTLDALVAALPTVTKQFQSMYTPGRIFLRLAKRDPIGWIATHWDKRDDDLDAFDGVPKTVTLVQGGVTGDLASAAPTLSVTIGQHVEVLSVPAARAAEVTVVREGRGQFERVVRATISIQSVFAAQLVQGFPGGAFDATLWAAGQNAVWQNLWRVKVGALPASGAVILYDEAAPLTFTPRAGTDGWLDAAWVPGNEREARDMALYLSEAARLEFGTSVWFIDVVGHASTAERTTFHEVLE